MHETSVNSDWYIQLHICDPISYSGHSEQTNKQSYHGLPLPTDDPISMEPHFSLPGLTQ